MIATASIIISLVSALATPSVIDVTAATSHSLPSGQGYVVLDCLESFPGAVKTVKQLWAADDMSKITERNYQPKFAADVPEKNQDDVFFPLLGNNVDYYNVDVQSLLLADQRDHIREQKNVTLEIELKECGNYVDPTCSKTENATMTPFGVSVGRISSLKAQLVWGEEHVEEGGIFSARGLPSFAVKIPGVPLTSTHTLECAPIYYIPNKPVAHNFTFLAGDGCGVHTCA